MRKKKVSRLQAGAIAAGILLILLILWDMRVVIRQVIQSGNPEIMRQYFGTLGWKGVVILFLLQMIQVITSLIPALSLQAAAGASYGLMAGTALILAGMTAGNMIVYLLAQRLLDQLGETSRIKQLLNRFDQFMDGRNKNLWCFLMFLLPILPNLVKPYLAAVTEIRRRVFLISCSVGSVIPVMAGAVIGNLIVEGKLISAGLVAVVAAVLAGIAVILVRRHPITEK